MRFDFLASDAYPLTSRFGLPCAAEPERHVLFHFSIFLFHFSITTVSACLGRRLLEGKDLPATVF